LENAANVWDKLSDICFGEDNMRESINSFRTTFELLVKVSAGKLDKTTLKTCWIFLVLKQLPSSFGTFRTLQYAGMKKPDTPLKISSFLNNLESELRRQQEAATMALPAAPTALAVSQQPQPSLQQPPRSGTLSRQKGPKCENGIHNPAVTSHTEDRCHAVHPELAVAHFQAALDRANTRMSKKAMLSAQLGVSDCIILDSGATGHYLKHRSCFTSLKPCLSTVFGANGASIPIVGEGSAVIPAASGPIQIDKAYFVPDLSNSLLSLTSYVRQGYKVEAKENIDRFSLRKQGHVLCSGSTIERVLIVDLLVPRAFKLKTNPIVLHNALGHPSLPYLKAAYPDLHVTSMEHILDCIHMDLCGPITPASWGGNRYFLKIIDGHSKYRFIYPMPRKSDTFSHFMTFLNHAENHMSRTLKSVVSDNGGEFVNQQFAALFKSRGIIHHTSAPHTPQQNPFEERGNHTTVEKARALLLTAGMSLSWWGEAIMTSVYLENRSPDSSIGMKSPYELWYGKPPNLNHLQPFGCRAVCLEEKKWRKSKFSPSGVKTILIGFDDGHCSYKLWVPASKRIKISHHVCFFPMTFPHHESPTAPSPHSTLINWVEDLFANDPAATSEEIPQSTPPPTRQPTPASTPEVFHKIPDETSADETVEDTALPPLPIDPRPVKGYAYVPHYDVAPNDINSNIDPTNIIERGRQHRANAVTLPPIHQAFVIVGEPASMKDPKTFSQAMRCLDRNEWLMAVEIELNNIRRHEVWVVAPMKTSTRLLDTVWVFKRKYNADGELLKYKAHLCV
jgi:hypothetical protein